MENNCIFCKIAAGEIPAKLVYQDDLLIAFHDINPQAPHHLLLVPRKHIATTLDIEDEDMELIGHIYRVAAKISLELGFADDGVALLHQNLLTAPSAD